MKKMNLRALCFSTLKAKHYVAAMAAAVAVAANFAGETAIIGGTFFAASAMSGCEKDTIKPKDGGGALIDLDALPDLSPDLVVFEVPAGKSQDELRQLIVTAEALLRAERKLTIQVDGIDRDTENGVSVTHSYKWEEQYDADAKKRWGGEWEDGVLEEFDFTDNDNTYAYKKYGYDEVSDTRREVNKKELRRPVTNAQKYFMYDQEIIEDRSSNYPLTFSLKGGKIVVSGQESATYEVTLAQGGKYKSVRRTESDGAEVRRFAYGVANPALPAGYSESQFENRQSEYPTATVVWGEDKGRDTFWGELKGDAILYGSDIARYAPDVAGKEIEKFTANGQDYCVSYENCTSNNYSITLTEGMTITAVWKDK